MSIMNRGMHRTLVLALAVTLTALGALPAGAATSAGDRGGVRTALVDLFSPLWQVVTGEFGISREGTGGAGLRADADGAGGGLGAITAADGTDDPPPTNSRGTADPDG
jgi:hypothetical protein